MQQCDNVIRMQIVATYEEETCEFVQPTTGTCFKRKDKKVRRKCRRINYNLKIILTKLRNVDQTKKKSFLYFFVILVLFYFYYIIAIDLH